MKRIEKLYMDDEGENSVYYKDHELCILHNPVGSIYVYTKPFTSYYLDDLFHNVENPAYTFDRYGLRGRRWSVQDQRMLDIEDNEN